MTDLSCAFRVSGLAEQLFRVVGFEGEEALGTPYRFEIDVVSDDATVDLDALIAQDAVLTIRVGDDERRISGIVWAAAYGDAAAGGAIRYHFTLCPRLTLLRLSRGNRSFGTRAPLSVVEVISAVLSGTGEPGRGPIDHSFRLLKAEDYPKRDLWVQYGETDFDFMHRLLEHWGIFYCFEETADGERLLFSDSSTLAPVQEIDAELNFEAGGDLANATGRFVRSYRQDVKAVSSAVRLRDYNPDAPHLDLSAESRIATGSAGAAHEYGTHFLSAEEGARFARIRAEEIGAGRTLCQMRSDSPFLATGRSFTLKAHPRGSANGRYFLSAIRHEAQQPLAGGFAEAGRPARPGYRNMLTALPAAIPFRPKRQTPWPSMPPLTPALIDAGADHDTRALLDPQGRYKVALDFDTASNPDGQHAPFIREIHPYAGPTTGLHFPMPKGTEVMIGWVNGDPDRPIILGAAPNPRNPSPVTAQNRTQNILRSAAGMAFIMEDGPAPKDDTPQVMRGYNTAGNTAIYSALMVPGIGGALPNYLRLGDAVASNRVEKQIVADPGFGTSLLPGYRPAEANSPAYDGYFSHTPQNRTITTGGNETAVTGGDYRREIRGNARTRVYGVMTETVYAPSPPASPPAAARETSAEIKTAPPASKSGAAAAGTSGADGSKGSSAIEPTVDPTSGRTLKKSVTTQSYTADVIFTPTLSYTLGQSFTYTAGSTVSGSAGFASNFAWSPIGSYSYSVGPKVSLSGTPFTLGALSTTDYQFDASDGGLTQGIDGFDSGFARFTNEKIVFGYRDGATLSARKRWTTAVSAVSAAATAGGEALAQMVLAQDDLDSGGGAVLGAQNGVTAASILAFGLLMAKARSYFNGDHKALAANLQLPTLVIEQAGITLAVGTSTIKLTANGIEISADEVKINAASAAAPLAFKADAAGTTLAGAALTLSATNNLTVTPGGSANITAGGAMLLQGSSVTVTGGTTFTNDLNGQKVTCSEIAATTSAFAKKAEAELLVTRLETLALQNTSALELLNAQLRSELEAEGLKRETIAQQVKVLEALAEQVSRVLTV